jgi:two-component system, OmpR family, alkaline phosphatase synthesis response regulator PhoP
MTDKKARVLIVDDEEDILDFLSYNLKKEGYDVVTVDSGRKCLENMTKQLPDVVLLDIMMPGISGIDVCKKIKADTKTKDIPVIMLTAKITEKDIVTGLNSGADDYIVKPFSMRILIARIKAQLRRLDANTESNINIRIGDLTVNTEARQVLLKNKKIELTYSRFEILTLFIKNPGKVFSRKQIVKEIRGDNYPVTERAIDVHIVEMRRLLKEYGNCIKTVRGVGYKFSDEEL